MRPQFQLPSHSNYPSLISASQPHPGEYAKWRPMDKIDEVAFWLSYLTENLHPAVDIMSHKPNHENHRICCDSIQHTCCCRTP